MHGVMRAVMLVVTPVATLAVTPVATLAVMLDTQRTEAVVLLSCLQCRLRLRPVATVLAALTQRCHHGMAAGAQVSSATTPRLLPVRRRAGVDHSRASSCASWVTWAWLPCPSPTPTAPSW